MYDKAKIMRRAWELMRTKYRMGNPFTFQQIGRGCLAWCMGEAWRKAKEAARVAAIPLTGAVCLAPRVHAGWPEGG